MNNTKQKVSHQPPPASVTLRDIYYVIFRHKWLIMILLALGLASSFFVYTGWPFPYTSEAKIFIRYIQDSHSPGETDGSVTVTPVGRVGDSANVLNTELEILNSTDLYLQVATNVGPEKILGRKGDSNMLAGAAAGYIRMHLKTEVTKNTDVIYLQFTSKDPIVPQLVLSALIEAYRNAYRQVHLATGFTDASLSEQTDMARLHMQDAVKTLEDQKRKYGIASLTDAKKNATDRLDRIRDSIMQVQGQLAEADSTIKDLQERIPAPPSDASGTNHSTNGASAPARPTPDVVAQYQRLNTTLNTYREKERKLLDEFTPANKQVQAAQHQRETAEADLKAFEAKNPGVIAYKPAEPGSPVAQGPLLGQTMDPRVALQEALLKRNEVLANYKVLTNQLSTVRVEVSDLDGAENSITQAENDKNQAEHKYEELRKETDRFRIQDAVGNKITNISTVEQPTAPGRDPKKILKVAGGVLGFFLVVALGLPFLIEMVLDQTLKHPQDVQARIGAPFFITIPRTNAQSRRGELKRAKNVPLLANGHGPASPDAETPAPAPVTDGPVAPWDHRHELRPYFETLRDRLMTYFEMINLTHKPKLVAVTSCGEGAGVTTTAAGLASSLSETGEGNVLLVSMNVRDGEAQHFYKGQLNCGIEDALVREKRDHVHVQEKLFVAKEMEQGDDSLPRMLPKRFSHLVPLMKASDFDYIIFDMPPVSDISITPRLARFMDMVLLVVESEKTPRDAAVRTASLLADSKTNVGLVLNKNRSYVPKRLESI